MKIGFVGLGRMGAGMTHRLLDAGHEVHAWNRSEGPRETLASQGGTPAASIEELVSNLGEGRRAVWVMVPSGAVTEETITHVAGLLREGDIVIDGGNSRFTDGKRRSAELAKRGIVFVDAGTSGGVWGYQVGYCLMVGGPDEAIAHLAPALTDLAPPDGWLHCGPAGAGHFVKMVHNGIEYALMQSYGEGFEVLEKSEFGLDLHAISEVWRHSSVVRSWLLDLLAAALAEDPKLEHIKGYVDDSGEGRWTVFEAINESVATPAIAISLMARFTSRDPDPFSMKAIAALRNQFGGHAVVRE
ncbi:MAG TPA: decarboxylating 6-phosphogluconate dehydrogenase [Gaiellales bacterium]|nr:decarboxylating 6-phosphogluconate dehydrogenase [Gaiellales bacterium]